MGLKYKEGDRVRIKSIDWYYDNRDRIDEVACGNTIFVPEMVEYCEKIVTISSVLPTLKVYRIKEDGGMFNWTDEMIECKVEEETKPQYEDEIELIGYSSPKQFLCPIGYEFRDENDNIINAQKIVLKKKKPKYPKTYEECCKVLGLSEFEYNHTGTKVWYRHRLMATLDKLMLCRDAYWKLYGEEKGLGKPWEPDYDSGVNKYGIICMNGVVQESNPTTNWERHLSKVLDFPTAEMRDTFKKNFDPDIEICKEFL